MAENKNNNIQVRRDNPGGGQLSSSRDMFSNIDQFMDRFFSDPFGSFVDLPVVSRRSFGQVRETDSAYVLLAEIPGVPKEDVQINVNGNTLTISAEHSEEKGAADQEQGYRREYRSFHQSFSLPTTVDAGSIEAHVENGILEVLLPKTEKAQAKKIEVQSGKGGFLSRLTGKESKKH